MCGGSGHHLPFSGDGRKTPANPLEGQGARATVCYSSVMGDALPTGKARWVDYQAAHHFVWIPKERRGAYGRLIHECCAQHRFTAQATEADVDHAHRFVSGTPRWAPAASRAS